MTTTVKLDDADFENIYLRVREKLFWWLVAMLTLVVAISGYSGYVAVQKTAERAASAYVSGTDFKASIEAASITRLKELKVQADSIETRMRSDEKRIVAGARLPITIAANRIEFADPNGTRLRLEFGQVSESSKVVFDSPFEHIPIVLLTPIDNPGTGRSAPTLVSPTVSREGFSVAPSMRMTPNKFSWLAIGQ